VLHDEHLHEDEAWIWTLAPFTESVDQIRICPDDPLGDERLQEKLTSYLMNGYLGIPAQGSILNYNKLSATSKTVMMFEAAAEEAHDENEELEEEGEEHHRAEDHTDSPEWFEPWPTTGAQQRETLEKIRAQVAVERHSGSSHFLYADGHVELVSDAQVHEWVAVPFDFARPPQ
jgi:prepilin-type processing-associated H-X9-DG protein